MYYSDLRLIDDLKEIVHIFMAVNSWLRPKSPLWSKASSIPTLKHQNQRAFSATHYRQQKSDMLCFPTKSD